VNERNNMWVGKIKIEKSPPNLEECDGDVDDDFWFRFTRPETRVRDRQQTGLPPRNGGHFEWARNPREVHTLEQGAESVSLDSGLRPTAGNHSNARRKPRAQHPSARLRPPIARTRYIIRSFRARRYTGVPGPSTYPYIKAKDGHLR
jgi:hypothetical protein